jgi:hypothetical protein
MKLFELVFMEPARLFLASLEPNVRAKVIYTMEHAQYTMDANRFKKLTSELWEFRTLYARKHSKNSRLLGSKNETSTFGRGYQRMR